MNQTRFLELLHKEEVLKLENKSLYRVNRLEFSELNSYIMILQQQIYYKNRFQYINLIKRCLDGEINCYKLQWDFFEMYQNDMKTTDIEKLIKTVSKYEIDSEMNFDIDSKIENFSSLLDDRLVPMCDFLDDSLSEESFYRELQQIYSEMLKD